MSSASKGRYQSRLFNFFHKQSRRFGEGFGRSLRQLQVATSWSLEALSKSIYLLLQKAADSAGTQLSGVTEAPRLQLQPSEPPLAADYPICQVLENLESIINKGQFNSVDYSCEQIQGVASQIHSQNLVIVIGDNEILDALTPLQQQTLENQIISEIANYWHSWRLSQVEQKNQPSSKKAGFLTRLTSSSADRATALTPVTTKRASNNLQNSQVTLALLDTAFANLETNALAPLSKAQKAIKQRGNKLIQLARKKLDIFLYGSPELTVNRTQVIADSNLETQKSKMKALISAAFNYFYSQPEHRKIQKNNLHRPYLSSTKPKTLQLQNGQSPDDWLSSSDLFGNGFSPLHPSQSSVEANNTSEKRFGRFQIPYWRTLQLKEKAGLQQPQKSIIKTAQISEKITITSAREISQTQTRESTKIEAKPEWIETKAEMMGYQKHPLEQLLALIDSAMLKIEESFAKLANVLQRFWQK